MPLQSTEEEGQVWKRFTENKVLDLQGVRSDVARSWQRCRDLDVDPFKPSNHDINVGELRERIHQKKTLVKIVTPYMNNLYNFIKGTGFQVVLSDEQGILLQVIGDPEIVRRTKGIQLCPGGNWSESAKGTNAIGSAIAERKPIQIHAWEHFCNSNHFLSCSAAPIFSCSGDMMGVLDVSGNCRFANVHSLGMVVSSVKAIENELAVIETQKKLSRYYNLVDIITDTISDGYVSIDSSGTVVDMNAAGGNILGIEPQNALGKHLKEVFLNRSPIVSLLGSNFGNKLHFNGKGDERFKCTASLLQDEGGLPIGAVAILKPCRNKQEASMKIMSTRYSFEDVVGESKSLQAAKKLARIAANSPSTVLLAGESGTGKELFAQAIHCGSSRRNGPFLSINCTAIPETLIESELFGYEEGAFTGSKKGGQAGKFENADGGTVFLDEIGDMPMFAQAKLLRVIQERKVTRVGSAREIPVDIRIIAATHKDLTREVANGSFRKDLYYRLCVLSIDIPALKERREDIPLLAEFILNKVSNKLGKQNIFFNEKIIENFQLYDWPGNIRELENVIEHTANMVEDGCEITPEFLPPNLEGTACENHIDDNIGNDIDGLAGKSLKIVEKQMIIKVLRSCRGNIRKASLELGASRSTVYRKIKEYNICIDYRSENMESQDC